MKPHWLMMLAVLACPVKADQLNLKTGAWEVTVSGGPLPRPVVEKECMTKADMADFSTALDKDDDADCKYDKPPSIVGRTWSVDRSCPDGRRVHAEFTADSSERMKGTISIVQGKNQKPSTVQMTAKWLGSSCSGIK